MFNIGIVTHYGVHNHGAQLQLFALLTILRNKGYDCHALGFDKNYRYMDKSAANKYSISIKSIPYYLQYLLSEGFGKTLFNVKKKRIFDKFRNENYIIGDRYEAFDGDLIVVGSDEVFSFETGVTGAFWGVNNKAKKLVSYAASFGPTTSQEIHAKQLENFVLDGLKRFSSISVRDENSVDIVKKFSNITPIKNCDPVIFYGYQKEISEFAELVETSEPYILLYSYDNNMNDDQDIEIVKKIADEKNLPVYSVGFYHSWCDKNFNASPLELLGWFKNAEFIITDTFHGTVLSLITNSVFATKVRGNGNKICNLLKEYDLDNRIFSNYQSCAKILDTEIDYDFVCKRMTDYRQEADFYLNRVLELI